jgi:hypothetical protein
VSSAWELIVAERTFESSFVAWLWLLEKGVFATVVT